MRFQNFFVVEISGILRASPSVWPSAIEPDDSPQTYLYQNIEDILSDVLYVLVEISGIEPLTS